MITRVSWSEERGGKTRSRRWLFPLIHLNEKLRSYRWVVTRSFVEELEAFGSRVRGGDGGALAGLVAGARTIELAEAATSGGDASPADRPAPAATSSGDRRKGP